MLRGKRGPTGVVVDSSGSPANAANTAEPPSVAPRDERVVRSRRWSAASAWGWSLALGALAALCYALLRQAPTHQFDAYWMVPKLLRRELHDGRHPLAFPVADALAHWLQPFGSLHERLKLVSGLGAGLAVAILSHASYRWTGDRRAALVAAAWFACLPATVHHATVMELHGQFLPFAALAIWCTVRAIDRDRRRPRWPGTVLGISTALAAAMHATGHLLVVPLAVWLLAASPPGQGRRPLVGMLLVHAAVSVSIAFAMAADTPPDAVTGNAIDFLAGYRLVAAQWPATVLGEWCWPFLPLAWILVWPAAWRRERPLLAALALALPAYLLLCQYLLVLPGRGYVFPEFGAYQLPLGALAAVALVRTLPERWWWAPFVVAVAGTAVVRVWSDKPGPDLPFGRAAVDYLVQHEVRLLVGGFDEYGGVFEVACTGPETAATLPRVLGVDAFLLNAARLAVDSVDALALWFHPRFGGAPVVLTEAAEQRLRAAGGVFTELVERGLPAVFERRPVTILDASGRERRAVALEPR